MRLLTSGDWHPDFSLLGVSRFSEVEQAVEQKIDVAINEKVDAYVFLGDLANPDSGGETFKAIELLQRTALRLMKKHIRSIHIAGNHDVLQEGTGATTLTPLLALEKAFPEYVTVVETPRNVILNREITACCLPYTAPSHTYDPHSVAKVLMRNSASVKMFVLGHLQLPGIHPGSETKDMPRGRDITFPFEATKSAFMRLNGHYHQRQVFDPKDGGPPIIIPGSLSRLNFSESSNEPGFLIIEI